MSTFPRLPFSQCGRTRRGFLADCGLGFTGLAMGAMLQRDGIVRANDEADWVPPTGQPNFPPKAKSVIWFFMLGGSATWRVSTPSPS